VPFPLTGDTRLVPWYNDGRLHLSVEPVKRRLTGHSLTGEGALRLGLDVRDRTLPVALRLTQQATGATLEQPLAKGEGACAEGWTALRAELPLDAVAAARPSLAGLPKEVAPETTATWAVEAVFPDGGAARVSLDRDLPPGRYRLADDARAPAGGPDAAEGASPGPRVRELSVEASAAGNLVVRDRVPHAVAYEVGLTPDGRLLVGGELPATAEDPVRMVLRHGRYGAEIGAGVERGPGDRFSASVGVGALPYEGRWYLQLRAARGQDTPVRVAPRTMHALPMELATAEGDRPVTLDRRFHDHLFVAAGSAVPSPDRGPFRQRMLRERRYPVLARRAFTPTVLYSSFDGLRCDDSPRAVHDEMVRRGEDFAHVWVVADRSTPVPAAARAVVHGSHAWYEALARSRCIVTNTHLPGFFRRREGQHVVQTGLGTPVMRFGQDLAGTLCADLRHMWPQPMRGDQWAVLLSPNAQSTPVLRRALAYTGEVAETGLPRNDLLSGEDRAKIAEDVRARLGLPRDRTVVLYAPTVRDDEAYDAARQRLHLTADLAELEAALGGTHVLLLRAHPLVADTVRTPDSGFVRDVTRHPDLAELLLAADVLVTDYSSLLADFAVTAKPVLLQTPDLAHMRDTLRGFTFDIEAQAPGPLLSTTAELVDALRDPAAAVRPYGAAYDAFRAAFCHLDDGGAAARVADLILRGPRI
jgi:CDP-glycerol glycerophosphotransferase